MAAATEKPIEKANTASGPEVKPIKRFTAALRRIVSRFFAKLLKLGLFIIILLALLGVVFWGAMRFKLIDAEELDAKWGLSQYPVVGLVLEKMKASLETAPEDTTIPSADKPGTAPGQPALSNQTPSAADVIPVLPRPTNPAAALPVPPLDDSELKKQEALKREEEQKRLSKLARLYNGMKPEEAAPILNEVDDPTVILLFNKMEEEQVAKIMTVFDPKRSARLSDLMLKGPAKPQSF